MGHAIVYCWKCQNRLQESDFEDGKAFQAGGRTSCKDCAGELVRAVSGKDREQLLSQITRAAGNKRPEDSKPQTKSSSRLLTVRTPAAGTPAVTQARTGGVPRAAWGVPVVILLVAVVAILRTGGPAAPPAPSDADREEQRRRQASEQTLAKARAGDAGADAEASVRLWQEAVAGLQGTPQLAEAIRGRDAALGRRSKSRSLEWADVDLSVARLEAAENYGKATEFLRAARGRHPGDEWTQQVDRRLAELADKEKAAAIARSKTGNVALVPRPGLALWIRGDTGVVLEGSKVARWVDQVDGRTELRQDADAQRPVFLPDGLNGKACLAFDGAATSLNFKMPVNGLEGLTCFLVSACASEKPGAAGSDASVLYWDEGVAASGSKVYLCPYQTGVRFKFGTGQKNGDLFYRRPSSLGDQPTLTMIRKDGAIDALWTDGVLVKRQEGMGPRIASCSDRGALGIGKNNSHFSGRIAEVLLYGRALPEAEQNQVERYLIEKYGLGKK